MKKLLLSAALAMVASGPALAQTTPPPANAHAFITLRLQGYQMHSAGVVATVNSSGCTSTVTTRWSAGSYSSRYIVTVNWRTVSGTSVTGNVVSAAGAASRTEVYAKSGNTFTRSPLPSATFDVGDPQMALRIQKAFDVLRTSCDPTGGLGF